MSAAAPHVTPPNVHRGLTEVEVSRQRLVHGDNRVVVRTPTPVWRRVLDQLRDPMILVLLAAAALTLVTGDLKDAVIIASVVLVNTCVGVVQELRASNAVAALSALAAPSARVRRDGVTQSVAADQLVPGDVVELAEGDVIPADCQLLDAAALLVDEAALTGESVPVEKTLGSGPSAHVEDGRVSAGTVVVRGRAVAVVSATGAASAMGRIAALMDTGPTMTPLQHRLAGLGRVLAIAAGALCLVVAVMGLVRGEPLELMAVTAISLVVAAVPESLPAVVTLSLALGAKRMAARRSIVRRLAAVETLGAVTILATDKTGTLTEGRMVAEVLWTPVGEATVTGTGYAPVGEIRSADERRTAVTGAVNVALVALLEAAVVCNDATLEPPEVAGGIWNGVGDPTEAALLAVAGKLGVEVEVLGVQRVDELPFDSLRRRMTTLHVQADGRWLVAGMWQRLLPLGALLGAISLGVGWWARSHGAPWQSCLFLALAAAQLGVAIGVRARPRSWQNPFLLWAVAAAFTLQVLAVSLPPLQRLLGTESLTISQVVQVSAVSALGYVVARLQVVLEVHRHPGA